MNNSKESITPKVFVEEFGILKSDLMHAYFSEESQVSRINQLKQASFNDEQIEITKRVVEQALKDALYTVVLGLDGCSSIGRHQISYKVLDENDVQLTGMLEPLAFDQFHSSGA